MYTYIGEVIKCIDILGRSLNVCRLWVGHLMFQILGSSINVYRY